MSVINKRQNYSLVNFEDLTDWKMVAVKVEPKHSTRNLGLEFIIS
jgi:hypothetical protein